MFEFTTLNLLTIVKVKEGKGSFVPKIKPGTQARKRGVQKGPSLDESKSQPPSDHQQATEDGLYNTQSETFQHEEYVHRTFDSSGIPSVVSVYESKPNSLIEEVSTPNPLSFAGDLGNFETNKSASSVISVHGDSNDSSIVKPSISESLSKSKSTARRVTNKKERIILDNNTISSTPLDILIKHKFSQGMLSKSEKTRIHMSEMNKGLRVQAKTEPLTQANREQSSNETTDFAGKGVYSGPQLVMVDGCIQIDRSSLVVKRQGASEDLEEINEGFQRLVTSSSFLINKRLKKVKWDKDLTDRFYEGLSYFGTDFNLISMLFEDIDRKQIKSKFNVEEKINSKKLTAALRNRRPVSEVTQLLKDKIMSREANSEQPDETWNADTKVGFDMKVESTDIIKGEEDTKADCKPETVHNENIDVEYEDKPVPTPQEQQQNPKLPEPNTQAYNSSSGSIIDDIWTEKAEEVALKLNKTLAPNKRLTPRVNPNNLGRKRKNTNIENAQTAKNPHYSASEDSINTSNSQKTLILESNNQQFDAQNQYHNSVTSSFSSSNTQEGANLIYIPGT